MLKKIFLPVLVGLLCGISSWTFQSCNFLDIDPYITDMQSLDTVFQKKEQTLAYLYNVYSYMPNNGASWSDNGAPWVPVSDECFGTFRKDGYSYNYFATNEMDANDAYYVKWKQYYQGIRTASIFLKRVYECKELNSMELRQSLGEAQFLRAYYYFELMKQYGPVCLAPDEGFQLDAPISDILIPRNTWDECVAFVSSELKKAAANLLPGFPASDFGKPTSGTANAVLSRLLLYNASPLYNGNTSYAGFINKVTGKHYFNQEVQDVKWAEAAVAAKKVIEEGPYMLYTYPKDDDTPDLPEGVTSDPDFYKTYPEGAAGIDHYKSYSNIFNGTVAGAENIEMILGRPNMAIDKHMGPLKMYGWSSYNITQKLVNAYYMQDGSSVLYPSESLTENQSFSGYLLMKDVHSWYVNREMRFYATVGFSGSYYWGTSASETSMKKFQAEFFKGGNCSKNYYLNAQGVSPRDPNSYCMTGYLCRKFQHIEDCYHSSYSLVKPKVWTEYRLAEIYLNYVEALNELTREYTVDEVSVHRDPTEIKKYFNLIRHRAGLPGMTSADANNPDRVRELIRRERQIELAWEGHRYFDVRRWKIANEEENGPVQGLNVNKPKGSEFYTVVDVKEASYAYKAFSPRKYFWPIPQSEIIKNTNLDQNPYW